MRHYGNRVRSSQINTSSPQTGSSIAPLLPTQYQVVVMDRQSAELAKHVPEKAAVSYTCSLIITTSEIFRNLVFEVYENRKMMSFALVG